MNILTPLDSGLPALVVIDGHYACPSCGCELELVEVLTTPEMLFRYLCKIGHEAIVEAKYLRAKLPRIGVN